MPMNREETEEVEDADELEEAGRVCRCRDPRQMHSRMTHIYPHSQLHVLLEANPWLEPTPLVLRTLHEVLTSISLYGV